MERVISIARGTISEERIHRAKKILTKLIPNNQTPYQKILIFLPLLSLITTENIYMAVGGLALTIKFPVSGTR